MKAKWILMTVMSCCLIWASAVDASIIGGTATKIAPPLNVGQDNQQSPLLMGFDERQSVWLTSPLAIDDPAGPIQPGMYVDSHYVLYDPAGNSRVVGTIVFDADILGIMTATATLAGSDFLGAPGTNYLSPSLRGLEGGDIATITNNRTVSVDFTAASPGDYIRVITLPEPATMVLLAAGLPLLWKRRRGD